MRWATRALAAGLTLVLLACTGAGPSLDPSGGTVAKDRTLTVWLGPVASLHPHETINHLTAALFSPLVVSSSDTHLPAWGDDAPGAMLESIASEDLQRWTLTLKEGWRWHDGSPVVAEDVVRGWTAARASGLPLTSTISEATALDERTVDLQLAAPFGQLPHLLAEPSFLPLPPLAERAPSRFAAAPIGTGPYALAGRVDGDYELAAVAEHPLSSAASEPTIRVQLTDEPDAAARVIVGRDGQDLPQAVLEDSRRRLQLLPGRQLAYLALPLTDERFASPAVRRALSLAIDTEALAAEVMQGRVLPADRLLGPGIARAEAVTCEACTHDPAAAAELWPADFREPLTIWFAADAGHEPVIDFVAESWSSALGVDNLQLATLPAEELLDRLGDNEVSGPFRLSWQADVASPSRVLPPLFGPRGIANDARYRSPAAADLLTQAGLERDLWASLDVYAAAERAILADLPIIPLWFSTMPVSVDPGVGDVVLDGEGRLDWTALARTG